MYIEALLQALAAQVVLSDNIDGPDLQLASRCEGWLVRDVVNHSIAVTLKFAAFASGETDSPRTPPGDHIGHDHRSAIRRAAGNAEHAWRRVDRTRVCHLPFGSFPASTAAGINLFDVLAHSWDVAGPTANPLPVADDVWAAGLSAARVVIGDERDPRHYGRPHETGSASPTPRQEFLAYLGRIEVTGDGDTGKVGP